FKKILYTLGGVAGVLALLYVAMDYGSPIDQQILSTNFDGSGKDTIGRLIVSGLKSDRSGMFGAQVLRTFAFLALMLGLIWLYLKNVLKPAIVVAILGLVTLTDLLLLDSKYLNEDLYHSRDDVHTSSFSKTPIDDEILKDKSIHYRVYNAGQDKFSSSDYRVSIFHKAIGGYHPAKLRLYQDIMERYLYGNPNPQVLNMLNTKYILTTDPQNGQQAIIPNPSAYGPCWLVKNIKLVKDDTEELQAVGATSLGDTAIVQQSLASLAGQPQWDSASSISLTKFDNDVVEYSASCNGPQFAVFSEVYYPYGWNAYVDGKKVDYVRTDYVLRGLSLPAGKHAIRFVFEPASYKKGITLSYTGSFLVVLLVLGGLFMAIREKKKEG
ncbi:MAG TPA: YfhO family protein, partial [Chitinophagaceae bacterium]|nr:YfhO family protein [Chitinophagaceae bacterium]